MIVIHDNRFSGAEPRKALLEAKIWMLEAYKSTDSDFIETFADFYFAYLDSKLSASDFARIQDMSRIKILVSPKQEERYPLDGFYDKDTDAFIFIIDGRSLDYLISKDKYLYREAFKSSLSDLYEHEDTHRQQAKKYFDYDKGYKTFSGKKSATEAYYDQQIEADAYARQIGKKLIRDYGADLEVVFDKISKNEIEDSFASYVINMYKNNKLISDENKQKFMSTLYEYIEEKRERELKKTLTKNAKPNGTF